MTDLELQLLASRRQVLERLADEVLASDYRSVRVKVIRLRHIKSQLEGILKEMESQDA